MTHRLLTDLNGNIHFQSELPSPYQYLTDCKIKKINNNKNNNKNDNKNDNKNNSTYLNLLPSIHGDGIESTMITIAPAAPSLDLLPGWETQQFDRNSNQYSIHKLLALQFDWDVRRNKNDNRFIIGNDFDYDIIDNQDNLQNINQSQKFLNNLNESNLEGEGGEFVDRIAPLSLCPGEIRYEYVLAVLQPLLTGVLVNDDKKIEINSNDKIGLSVDNNSLMKMKMKMKTKKVLNLDKDLGFIADDFRISVHQWSKPVMKNRGESLLTPKQLQSPVKSNKLSQQNNPNSICDNIKQMYCSTPDLKSNDLVKASLLQRDFSGPLKERKEETVSFRSKVLPITSTTLLNCKLIGCYNKEMKSKNDVNTNISDLIEIDDRNSENVGNSLSSSSLSVPLGFEFEFSSDVVAYRIDVETLALDSGKNNNIVVKDKMHRDEDGDGTFRLNPSQLYLRRLVRHQLSYVCFFKLQIIFSSSSRLPNNSLLAETLSFFHVLELYFKFIANSGICLSETINDVFLALDPLCTYVWSTHHL